MKSTLDKLTRDFSFDDLDEEFSHPEFTLKDIGVSARALQHWDEMGLLPNEKRKTDENHKFSFVDLIWLQIIRELRGFGMPLILIKEIQKTLYYPKPFSEIIGISNKIELGNFFYRVWSHKIKDKEAFIKFISSDKTFKNLQNKKSSLLHINIIRFLSNREDIKIIAFNNGTVMPICLEDFKNDLRIVNILETEPQIRLSLSKIISDFLKEDKHFEFVSRTAILNRHELKTLELIREKKYNSITIRFKNQEPFLIEATEKIKINKEARLSEIILSRQYEKIEIVTEDADIIYTNKTTKFKLK